jgi:hypothetical protein
VPAQRSSHGENNNGNNGNNNNNDDDDGGADDADDGDDGSAVDCDDGPATASSPSDPEQPGYGSVLGPAAAPDSGSACFTDVELRAGVAAAAAGATVVRVGPSAELPVLAPPVGGLRQLAPTSFDNNSTSPQETADHTADLLSFITRRSEAGVLQAVAVLPARIAVARAAA